jgi:DNA-binding XRE family transcriptional regulator
MELISTEALDSHALLRFYQDRGICLSYRQLREWERTGIIRSFRIGLRKKAFASSEVRWAGLACSLRLAGKGLGSIREMRLAAMPESAGEKKLDPKIRKQRLAEMILLLEKQRETVKMLIDAICMTDKGAVVVEYKRPKQEAESDEWDAKRQLESYKEALERSGMKNTIKVMRVMRRLSQHELAKKLAFSQSRLSQIENDWIQPDEGEQNRIARVLKVEVSMLFPSEAVKLTSR